MSKRFIDVSSLPKAFRKLDPSLKLTWYYLWNNCDASGVWEIDEDLFEFENGIDFNIEIIKKSFSQLYDFSEDKILIKDYIRINYSKLKENYNPHKPVFRKIDKNNLKLNASLNQASFKLEDEDEDKEEYFGKSENLLDKNKNVFKDKIENEFLKNLCNYFSQTNENLERKVWSFLNHLNNQNKYSEFKKQFLAYKEYKKISEEKIHSWLGYQAEWESSDWVNKLSKVSQKKSKVRNIVIN